MKLHKILLKLKFKGTIVVCLFCIACTSHKIEQQKIPPNAQTLFEKLLIEEGGIYTLFGSKPLTDILIYIGPEEALSIDYLSDEGKERVTYEEYPGIDAYEEWKEFAKKLHSTQFRIFEKMAPYGSFDVSCFLLNITEAKKVFEAHRELFVKRLGRDISFEQLLEETNDVHSKIWDLIQRDHQLIGLLYGYGEENTLAFDCETEKTFSNKGDPDSKHSLFPLPCYATSKQDQTTEKYKKERKQIQNRLKNKNLIEASLSKLIEK